MHFERRFAHSISMLTYLPIQLVFVTALMVCGAVLAQPVLPAVGDISADPVEPRALDEVRKLIASGRSKQALVRADLHLQKNPRDAQMRFVRGVILADMNDSEAARSVFQQLTEDFPELPEPYNNLAVLHAADGQLDRARAALESALVARPAARRPGRSTVAPDFLSRYIRSGGTHRASSAHRSGDQGPA